MLTSQGLFLATAMSVSVSAGTIILFELLRNKYFHSSQTALNQDSSPPGKPLLKSCLSSGRNKRANKQKNKKKRVQFADDVKEYSHKKENRKSAENVGFKKMPANQVALYSGIIKNRLPGMEYSC